MSMIRDAWSYYLYYSPHDMFEDLGLVSPPIAGIPGEEVPELVDLLMQERMPVHLRRNMAAHFGLDPDTGCDDIIEAFFQKQAVELRTLHDAVRHRKRKLTRREIGKYAAWSGLAPDSDEAAVRQDIIRRWEKSWFAQLIPALEKSGFDIDHAFVTHSSFFGRVYKDESGAFSVNSGWLNPGVTVRITYRSVCVLVERCCDDRGYHYTKDGGLIEEKWDLRYAPEEFERPLMEQAGFVLDENGYEGEFWFYYRTPDPREAIRAINRLKPVCKRIRTHFNAVHRSAALAREAEDLLAESPNKARRLANKALALNPKNKTARKIARKAQ